MIGCHFIFLHERTIESLKHKLLRWDWCINIVDFVVLLGWLFRIETLLFFDQLWHRNFFTLYLNYRSIIFYLDYSYVCWIEIKMLCLLHMYRRDGRPSELSDSFGLQSGISLIEIRYLPGWWLEFHIHLTTGVRMINAETHLWFIIFLTLNWVIYCNVMVLIGE